MDAKKIFDNLDKYSNNDERLQIDRIRIVSPGIINLIGFPGIIRETQETILEIINYKENRKKKRLEI